MLFAVTFQYQHHNVAWCESAIPGRLVEWGIEGLRLLFAHIIGNNKRRLFQCPEDGERRVKHDTSLGRTIDILVGVADGDGAGRLGETASNGTDTQWDGNQQRYRLNEIISGKVKFPVSFVNSVSPVPAWPEQFPKRPGNQCRQQHKIPVAQELASKNFQHLACALIAKLGKHRRGGSLSGKREIHAVHEIHVNGDTVHDGVDPTCHAIKP